MIELFAGGMALLGALFVLLAAVGTVRFPDVYMRMHAASKSTTLGLGCVLVGVMLAFPDAPSVVKCVLTVLFLFITTPIAAHMIARAAYLSRIPMSGSRRHDDLKGKYSEDHQRLQ